MLRQDDLPPDKKRLVFVDALRVSAIAFVIVHHAAQAFGPTGGFWPVHDHIQSGWFAPFYTANAAFGMGLMFLLAGYFVPPAYDRKGAWLFLQERWLRIGIPLVIFALFVHLPVAYLVAGRPAPLLFLQDLYERGWQPIYLHLWFIGQLLLYCFAYAVLRWTASRWARGPDRNLRLPSHTGIIGFIAALGLITWLVRIWYPVDKWVPLLWVFAAEPAHLAQYMSLFAVGIAAYRGDWFKKMPTADGLIWLAVGMVACVGIYLAYALGFWGASMARSGANLSSLIRSSWETVIAVGLSIGLVVAFRELFERSSWLLAAMTSASFGAYILHPAIVVGLQAAILNTALPVFAKFAVVSVLGIAAAFVAAHLIGRVPGIRAVLGAASSRQASAVSGVG